mmetsp:Transcript_121831/g.345309  ORF Transcript_121831/g.345309 Transcript_121831/m.345309 type:complete len:187 (+) Transcript_121831:1673-2233(+)
MAAIDHEELASDFGVHSAALSRMEAAAIAARSGSDPNFMAAIDQAMRVRSRIRPSDRLRLADAARDSISGVSGTSSTAKDHAMFERLVIRKCWRMRLRAAAEIDSSSGESGNSRPAKAHAVLVSPCALNAAIRLREAAAIAVLSGGWAYLRAAQDHAGIEMLRAVNAEMVGIAEDEIAVRRGSCAN